MLKRRVTECVVLSKLFKECHAAAGRVIGLEGPGNRNDLVARVAEEAL